MRKCPRKPADGGKENVVDTVVGLPRDMATDDKCSKPDVTLDGAILNDRIEQSPKAIVSPSLYKKLIVDDLTSTVNPSQTYWKMIAERRRKALVQLLDENQRLHDIFSTLNLKNITCNKLLESTTQLLETLKEMVNDSSKNRPSSPDSESSYTHVDKKMKMSSLEDDSLKD